jgi:hypothetical protein
MKPALTTEEALLCLAEGRARHVCLIKPGAFAVMVTYDVEAQEFVFAEPWCLRQPQSLFKPRRISIAEVLFQTEPRLYVPTSAA